MKKTYITPDMEIVKIQTTGMIATSMVIFDETVDVGNVLMREDDDNFWENDNDDFYF